MNQVLRSLPVAAATLLTTEVIFRLSRFQYGQGSLFGQPFDLVRFTVKVLWWFGVWFFFTWLFRNLRNKKLRH